MKIVASLLSWCVLLVACGGEPPTAEPESQVTAGGETQAPPDEGATVVLETTALLPLPQPATPRPELSDALQALWVESEELVAVRPPEPPQDASVEAIEAWARDDFVPWVDTRRSAIEGAEGTLAGVSEDDPQERAVAAALFGYMYEDTAAGIRGAPVPAEIATDEELLSVYVEALNGSLRPFARRAVESYVYCATTIAGLGETPWINWAQYCAERATDVARVFELASDSEP